MKNKTSIQTDAVLKEDHDSLYESLAKYRREMLGPSIGTFRKDDSVLWFSYTEDYLAALEILINQKLEHEQMPLTNYEKNRLTIPIFFVFKHTIELCSKSILLAFNNGFDKTHSLEKISLAIKDVQKNRHKLKSSLNKAPQTIDKIRLLGAGDENKALNNMSGYLTKLVQLLEDYFFNVHLFETMRSIMVADVNNELFRYPESNSISIVLNNYDFFLNPFFKIDLVG